MWSQVLVLCFLLLVHNATPGRVGREIVKTEGADVMACSEPEGSGMHDHGEDPRPNAYFVMIGPFTPERKYKKWLYAVIALSSALKQHGSEAEVVVLCAQRQGGHAARALPEEEALLSRSGIHWRYVAAPYGNSGFHMGHYKIWAWQHTEYARVQLLDADLLPLGEPPSVFAFCDTWCSLWLAPKPRRASSEALKELHARSRRRITAKLVAVARWAGATRGRRDPAATHLLAPSTHAAAAASRPTACAVNMDRFFDFGSALDSDFVGCPGKLSVLNAGWFVLRPSCHHFEAMSQVLKADTGAWDKVKGWGHELPYWLSSEMQTMKVGSPPSAGRAPVLRLPLLPSPPPLVSIPPAAAPPAAAPRQPMVIANGGRAAQAGWDFFDAHGNQGHMYSYFLFEAMDLTLIYADGVRSYGNGSLAGEQRVLERMAAHDPATAAALRQELYAAYPCPFPLHVKERAYIHFTGNLKPWTKKNPGDPRFKLWYDAVTRSGDVNLDRDVFAA